MNRTQQHQYDSPAGATITGIISLFRKRHRVGMLTKNDRLDNKRVLVTGSSSGLGFATAIELARRGAEVIMAVRSGIPDKGEAVKRISGSDKVFMHPMNLTDLDSIRQLAASLKSTYGSFDIVICNAAVVAKKGIRTPSGLEQMFMVNYLAKYLFLRLMLKNGSLRYGINGLPRIIFVASESHRNPKDYRWDEFGTFVPHSIGKTVEIYGYYKLLLVTFTRELSRRLNDTKTTASVFALCPGPVNSNIAREAPVVFKPLLWVVFSLFFRSPKKACEPVIYLAASRDVEGLACDYLHLMERKEVDEKANDPVNGKKLWDLSEKLILSLGIHPDEI